MGRKYCSVKGCRYNNFNTLEQTNFFRFPKETIQRIAWTKFVNREGWAPKENSYLCQKHFKNCDVIISSKCVRLKHGTIPELHLPQMDGGVSVVPPPQVDSGGSVVHPTQTDDEGSVVHPPQTDNEGSVVHPTQMDSSGSVVHPTEMDSGGSGVHPTQMDRGAIQGLFPKFIQKCQFIDMKKFFKMTRLYSMLRNV